MKLSKAESRKQTPEGEKKKISKTKSRSRKKWEGRWKKNQKIKTRAESTEKPPPQIY